VPVNALLMDRSQSKLIKKNLVTPDPSSEVMGFLNLLQLLAHPPAYTFQYLCLFNGFFKKYVISITLLDLADRRATSDVRCAETRF